MLRQDGPLRTPFSGFTIIDIDTAPGSQILCHGTLGSTVEKTSSGSKCRSNVTLINTKADTVQKQN